MGYERTSVDLSGFPDLVVIYLGYRVKSIRALPQLMRLGRGLQTLRQTGADGLLAHERVSYSLLHQGFRQYWRDFESLEAFTKAAAHMGWWRDFARHPHYGGIWHETYRLRGGMEAIYSGMPQIGLASFAPPLDPVAAFRSARQRLGAEAMVRQPT